MILTKRPLYALRLSSIFRFLLGYWKTRNKQIELKFTLIMSGLFKEDALDKLEIDNDLLSKHTQTKEALKDFESQVDVNILGHILKTQRN
jgi:hypothetical protein